MTRNRPSPALAHPPRRTAERDPVPREVDAGWAHMPMHGGQSAHWYIRGEGGHLLRVVRSACGLVAGYETAAVRLLEPGKMPQCRHCERSLAAKSGP